jgi:hypothetical protein
MRGIRGRQLYKLLFYGVIFAVAALGALAYTGVREIRQCGAQFQPGDGPRAAQKP